MSPPPSAPETTVSVHSPRLHCQGCPSTREFVTTSSQINIAITGVYQRRSLVVDSCSNPAPRRDRHDLKMPPPRPSSRTSDTAHGTFVARDPTHARILRPPFRDIEKLRPPSTHSMFFSSKCTFARVNRQLIPTELMITRRNLKIIRLNITTCAGGRGGASHLSLCGCKWQMCGNAFSCAWSNPLSQPPPCHFHRPARGAHLGDVQMHHIR